MRGRPRLASVTLALGGLTACGTAPPPPAPPSPTTATRPEAPADPCAGDCLGDLDRLVAADPARARARIQTCLGCPDAPVQAFARAADLSARAHALAILRAGTEQHPHAALLWRLRGRTALDAGLTDEGIAALTRAARLRPDDPGVESELLSAQRSLPDHPAALARPLATAQRRLARRDVAGARRALDEADAAATRPEDRALVLHRRALVSIAAENTARALQETQAGLRLAPAHARAVRAELLVTLADLYIAANRAEDALFAAATAAELAPRDPLAHANLAVARALGGDVDGTLTALSAAIDAGLPTRLSRTELTAIAAIAPLLERPEFAALVDGAWPSR